MYLVSRSVAARLGEKFASYGSGAVFTMLQLSFVDGKHLWR